MKFVDECEVTVHGGDGGNGAVAFRREKYVPHGGPAGGDGGNGADVVFVGDEGLSTLMDLTYARTIRAKAGQNGQGKDCYGRAGEDTRLRVPVGTRVFDNDSGEVIGEVIKHGQSLVVARGGHGGRGNIHFATPFDRAPRRAEPGTPGEVRNLRLELLVLADAGLLGFPNVGKSTLIRRVSRARPKVAEFPFTTLRPHLGIVEVGQHDSMLFALADIPGLIPGASAGAGLGIQFLKHLKRTRVLLHLVTLDPSEGRDPIDDYHALRKELALFDPHLASRREVVAMSKMDLPEVQEAFPQVKASFEKLGIALRPVSAATGAGAMELMSEIARLVVEERSQASQTADDAESSRPEPPHDDDDPEQDGH